MDILFSADLLFSSGVIGLFLLIFAYVASNLIPATVTPGNIVFTLALGYLVSSTIQDTAIPLNIRYIFFLSSVSLFCTATIFYLRLSRYGE